MITVDARTANGGSDAIVVVSEGVRVDVGVYGVKKKKWDFEEREEDGED